MVRINVKDQLASLRDSVERMKNLYAWLQLKRAEARAGLPPAFEIYDPTLTDLRDEYSRFLDLSAKIPMGLHSSPRTTAPVTRTHLMRELQRLQQDVHSLNLRKTLGMP